MRTKTRRVGVLLWLAILLTSCGILPAPEEAEGCPSGWQIAIMWSTQNGPHSELIFIEADSVLQRRTVPYVGFNPVPGNVEDRSGSDLIMVANGNLDRDQTNVVSMSTLSCDLSARRVPEPVVLGIASHAGDVYTTNSINGEAQLRRRDSGGNVKAEVAFPAIVLSELIVHDDILFAFAADDATDQSVLLVLDPATLAERNRIKLEGSAGTAEQAIVKGSVLYYPQTLTVDNEGTKLGMIDLRTFQQSTIELDSPAPFLIIDAGDHLYIGHTFINPGYRPMSDYRWVSRYNLATGKVERFDVGGRLGSMAIRDQVLYVLNSGEDDEPAKLRSFDLPSMTPRSTIDVPRPNALLGHYYASGLIAR
ncbi:hypothetical protein [Microlunatus speluncae]|uniref:hypothetical protein n=1 Tax=Microlunatus speluncae TaxID=2594267 RepID=UPI0012663145|nr:hypothetical protein [Microlunatus speluncae]